jgi:hypothetical protein
MECYQGKTQWPLTHSKPKLMNYLAKSALANWPLLFMIEDEEELTDEDCRALRASQEYFRNGGQGISFEEVVADLGFTMEQICGAASKE